MRGGFYYHVLDTPFDSAVRAFFFLFLEKEKMKQKRKSLCMRETTPLGYRSPIGSLEVSLTANFSTRVSVSRVKSLPEFKIAKLSFVNIEFFIYSTKP